VLERPALTSRYQAAQLVRQLCGGEFVGAYGSIRTHCRRRARPFQSGRWQSTSTQFEKPSGYGLIRRLQFPI